MAVYRRPFATPGEDRRPTLTWPRQIPIDGEPADVVEIVAAYADWLSQSTLPKLYINADPGAILIGPQREFCRSWPSLTEVTVKGAHSSKKTAPTKSAKPSPTGDAGSEGDRQTRVAGDRLPCPADAASTPPAPHPRRLSPALHPSVNERRDDQNHADIRQPGAARLTPPANSRTRITPRSHPVENPPTKLT